METQRYTTVDMLNLSAIEEAAQVLRPYSVAALGLYRYGKHAQEDITPQVQDLGETATPLQMPVSFEKYTARVNQQVLENIAETYKVSLDTAQTIYATSLNDANALVDLVLEDSLPEQRKNLFGLRNEVRRFSREPADRIWRLADQARDDIERFQILRQLELAHMYIDLNATYPDYEINNQIYLLQNYLNAHLYNGQRNHGNIHHEFSAWLGPDNEYFGNEYVEGSHQVDFDYSVRRLKNGAGDIFILTNERIKGKAEAGSKAVHKSMKKDGVIDLPTHVQDLAGMRFTVMGGTEQRDYVYQRILDVMNQRMLEQTPNDMFSRNPLLITNVTPNEIIDGRSTNGNIDWRRADVEFYDPVTDQEMILELIVDDIEVFTNAEGYFGCKKDPRKPRAHKIYEIERAQALFKALYPQDVYASAYEKIDVEKEMETKKQSVISSLKTDQQNEQSTVLT